MLTAARCARALSYLAFVTACDREPQPAAGTRAPAEADGSIFPRLEERPRDFMPCGDRSCDAKTSYCEIYLSDVPEPPSDYECRPLPAACLPNLAHPPSCECFPLDTPCLSFCGPLPTAGRPGFHLTCQGKRKPRAARPHLNQSL
jgi:hypothetical protein